MNNSLISSSVSLQALQQKLDVLANNIANVDTNGFKSKDASFQNILTNMQPQPLGFQQAGRLTPLGTTQSWGSKLSQVQTDLSQGTLAPTGVNTDLAIEGSGLFEITQKSVDNTGANVAQTAYTRDGAFNLNVNPLDADNLYLTTKNGDYVNSTDGQPIKVPVGYKMVVDAAGNVKGTKTGEADVDAGQLQLIRIVRPQFLQQAGDNIYILPKGIDNSQGQILQAVNGSNASSLVSPLTVRQGYVEQSNVDLSKQMTDLLATERAYQLSARAITSSDTMMNAATHLNG